MRFSPVGSTMRFLSQRLLKQHRDTKSKFIKLDSRYLQSFTSQWGTQIKNGVENFKYKGFGHYELREVCAYIVPYVISSYKLKFTLLNNISHAISAANEDQCKTSQWGRCHAVPIWAFCLVTSVSHRFIRRLWHVWQNVTFSLSSVIWSIQWFLVHWSISSAQNSCNWIFMITQIIFSFMVNEHLSADIKRSKHATP